MNCSIRKPFLGLFIFFYSIVNCLELKASHLRAGEIIATKKSTFEYEFTLILYRNTNGVQQPTATIDFGDGTTQTVPFSETERVSFQNSTEKLVYHFKKTFPGAANYTISFTEQYRNNGIENINNGFSGETKFYVETQINIDPLLGANTSPQFLAPPVDNGMVGQIFTHSPAAWDVDGDSLSFELISPQSQKGTVVPNYVLPNEIARDNSNPTFNINSQTGLVTWDRPLKQGLYNIAFRVNEWRNGYKIGYVVRDMQINILTPSNANPKLTIPNDTCITAGQLLKDTIVANYTIGETHRLTAYSGIFNLPAPTNIYNAKTTVNNNNLTIDSMLFEWQTGCELIRAQPYQVTFKAEDNLGQLNALATLKVWQIKIIPPAFQNLKAVVNGRKVVLSWDAYACSNVDSIAILRKECENDTSIVTDSCSTGHDIPAGYKLIKKVRKSVTSFTDDNFGKGLNYETQYCYYVYAQFPSPQKGYSRASALACVSLTNDVPLIIGASVLKTDSLSGEVEIKWTKPSHINQIQNPQPYKIQVFRKDANNFNTEIYNRSFSDTLSFDSSFIDKNVDTKVNNLNYFIQYYSNDKLLYTSETTSTVKLQGVASNKKALLKWSFNTPWTNDSSIVYRIADNDTIAIDTVSYTNGFVDKPLETGKLYRYFVETKGGFGCNRNIGQGKVPYPLRNLSQTISIIPTDEKNDTLKPCPPTLYINTNGNCDEGSNFSNTLYWHKNLDFLCDSNVVGYKLYNQLAGSQFELYLNETLTDTLYEGKANKAVSGCFAVTAINARGLESSKSNIVCSDSCYYYELPNVFTPNNDNINDIFTPKPFPRNIDKVAITVYNRWGAEVFKSEDNVNIEWTGENIPDGLYYYKAEITIGSRTGINEKKKMNGWILLTR